MIIVLDIWSGSKLVRRVLERKGKEGMKKKELEKEILKEAEKEQKKFLETDKALKYLVGKKPEHFVWISNYLDEILHYAEKMGIIKRKGKKSKSPTETFSSMARRRECTTWEKCLNSQTGWGCQKAK